MVRRKIIPNDGVVRRKHAAGFERRPYRGSQQFWNTMITLNNPTVEELATIRGWENELPVHVSGIGGQLELESTKHVQFYAEWTKRMTISSAKRALGLPRAHFEKRMGSQRQAIDYVNKERTRLPTADGGFNFMFGEWKQQGRRKDCLKTVCKMMDEGKKPAQIFQECPQQEILHSEKIWRTWIGQQPKRFLEAKQDNIIIIIGKTRTGKTTTAWQEWPDAYELRVTPGQQLFWQGYEGEDTVVINEFGLGGGLPYKEAKKLFDIYPMPINVKHGGTFLLASKVVITTTQHPKKWYPWIKDKEELEGRIQEFATIWYMRSMYPVGHPKEGQHVTYQDGFVKNIRSTTNFAFNDYNPDWKTADQDQY